MVKSSPPVLEVTDKFTSSAPSIEIVEVPSIVIAPEASISNAAESISIATSVSVPILIDVPYKLRASAPSITKAPAEAKVAPVPPSCVIFTSFPSPSPRTAPSFSKYTSFPVITSLTTDNPPSVCNEPSAVVVASVVSSVLTIPLATIVVADNA